MRLICTPLLPLPDLHLVDLHTEHSTINLFAASETLHKQEHLFERHVSETCTRESHSKIDATFWRCLTLATFRYRIECILCEEGNPIMHCKNQSPFRRIKSVHLAVIFATPLGSNFWHPKQKVWNVGHFKLRSGGGDAIRL